jgi:hypothetical protein
MTLSNPSPGAFFLPFFSKTYITSCLISEGETEAIFNSVGELIAHKATMVNSRNKLNLPLDNDCCFACLVRLNNYIPLFYFLLNSILRQISRSKKNPALNGWI